MFGEGFLAEIGALEAATVVVGCVAVMQAIVSFRDRKQRRLIHELNEQTKRADRLEHEVANLRARTDLTAVQTTLKDLLERLDVHMSAVNDQAKVMTSALAHQGEILERLITSLESNGREK